MRKSSPDILLVVALYSEDNPETGRPYYDLLYMNNYATIQVRDALARVEGVGEATSSALRTTACASGWTRTNCSRGT